MHYLTHTRAATLASASAERRYSRAGTRVCFALGDAGTCAVSGLDFGLARALLALATRERRARGDIARRAAGLD